MPVAPGNQFAAAPKGREGPFCKSHPACADSGPHRTRGVSAKHKCCPQVGPREVCSLLAAHHQLSAAQRSPLQQATNRIHQARCVQPLDQIIPKTRCPIPCASRQPNPLWAVPRRRSRSAVDEEPRFRKLSDHQIGHALALSAKPKGRLQGPEGQASGHIVTQLLETGRL